MIVAAAIQKDGVVYSVPRPGRHHDVIRHMVRDHGFRTVTGGGQGFIDSERGFVDRREAMQIAIACGQVREGLHHMPELYSEDVW